MKWKSLDQRNRDAAWTLLRGRQWKHWKPEFHCGSYFPLDWKEMPSNQFASAEAMKAAGWSMDFRRDGNGRLV